MMNQWCEAIQRDMSFRQQIDPEKTGIFTAGTGAPNYSPCALVMVDYTWRLIGVRDEPDELHWTIRPTHPAAAGATLTMRTDGGRQATMHYLTGRVVLSLDQRHVATIKGNGSVRMITDASGVPKTLIGVDPTRQHVMLSQPERPDRSLTIRPNEQIAL